MARPAISRFNPAQPGAASMKLVATGLLDRLLHHSVVVQIEGASYRLHGQSHNSIR